MIQYTKQNDTDRETCGCNLLNWHSRMSDDEMCEFCLQTITDNVFYDNINTIVNLFFPHKNNLSAGTSVCQSCLNNLESTYNFMTAVNGNNSKILDATIENDNEVCQTCLNPVDNPNIYLYDHVENIARLVLFQRC
ncbi:hypothetical protein NQ317_008249 [Molorchus minor]|uniref:ZAD domain-containing protein n=1 Tax=Molorchus minor TaxID=1323400 RepID=A0ABQ9J0A8_9CUCU|nr:hypothetical protein NQ317_008249 [Molorchus minor]